MPRRGQFIRVLYCEIGRILTHLLNVTTQAMDVGALTPPLWGFEEREKLMVFYERASGRADACHLFPDRRRAPGSAAEADRRYRRLVRSFSEGGRRYRGLLTGNRIFKQRNVDIGVVSLEEAWEWGFSGVMVRGSGAAWDLRKAQPYECYAEMDFDIPIGKNGDCYDRYCIRMEEMRQSVRIMKQCIAKLRAADGQGPVAVEDQKIVPPRRGEMKRSMEALIHHFKLYTEGFHVPPARSTPRSRRQRASSASIWSPTAATNPTNARSARRALRICRRWISSARATFWPTSRRSWAHSTSCSERSTGDGHAAHPV